MVATVDPVLAKLWCKMLLELSSLHLFNWSLTQEDVVGCITDSVESGKYNLINFTAIQVR